MCAQCAWFALKQAGSVLAVWRLGSDLSLCASTATLRGQGDASAARGHQRVENGDVEGDHVSCLRHVRTVHGSARGLRSSKRAASRAI